MHNQTAIPFLGRALPASASSSRARALQRQQRWLRSATRALHSVEGALHCHDGRGGIYSWRISVADMGNGIMKSLAIDDGALYWMLPRTVLDQR